MAYLRATRAELRKVHWPTRSQAWSLTKIVLGVTVAMGVFLGIILDNLFALGLRELISGNEVAIVVVSVLVVAGIVAALILSRQTAH